MVASGGGLVEEEQVRLVQDCAPDGQ